MIIKHLESMKSKIEQKSARFIFNESNDLLINQCECVLRNNMRYQEHCDVYS